MLWSSSNNVNFDDPQELPSLNMLRAPLKIAFFAQASLALYLRSSCTPCTLRSSVQCRLASTKNANF